MTKGVAIQVSVGDLERKVMFEARAPVATNVVSFTLGFDKIKELAAHVLSVEAGMEQAGVMAVTVTPPKPKEGSKQADANGIVVGPFGKGAKTEA